MKNDYNIKRLSRLTAMMTLIQSKKIVTAKFLSEKFNVSTRTIYRDIRALEQADIPILTEDGKGFSIMEGYKIPPVMFSENEAIAIITLEQIVAKMYDESLRKEFLSVVDKIKVVLRVYNKQKAELISERIYIGKNFENITKSIYLIHLQNALVNQNCVKIFYTADDGKESIRIIEPFSFYHNPEENWLMAAFCRLRNDFRIFRIDRITKINILDEKFLSHKISMKQFVEQYL